MFEIVRVLPNFLYLLGTHFSPIYYSFYYIFYHLHRVKMPKHTWRERGKGGSTETGMWLGSTVIGWLRSRRVCKFLWRLGLAWPPTQASSVFPHTFTHTLYALRQTDSLILLCAYRWVALYARHRKKLFSTSPLPSPYLAPSSYSCPLQPPCTPPSRTFHQFLQDSKRC